MTMAEFTGQTYGEASRQRASQRVVRPGPPPTQPGAPPAGPTGAMPEMLPFDRPTDFPDGMMAETGGMPLPIGVQPGSDEDLVLRVRAIASRFPNPALLQLVQELETRSGMA